MLHASEDLNHNCQSLGPKAELHAVYIWTPKVTHKHTIDPIKTNTKNRCLVLLKTSG